MRRGRKNSRIDASHNHASTPMHIRDLTRFLAELAENNQRAWFVMNRPRYDILRMEFLQLVTQLIAGIAQLRSGGGRLQPEESAVSHQPRHPLFARQKPVQNHVFRRHHGQRPEKAEPGRRPDVLLPHQCRRPADDCRRRIHAAGGSPARHPPPVGRRQRGICKSIEQPEAARRLWRPAPARQADAAAQRIFEPTVRMPIMCA